MTNRPKITPEKNLINNTLGFSVENYNTNKYDIKILSERIKKVKNKNYNKFNLLPKQHKAIIEKYLLSLEKIKKSDKLETDEYVLKGQELLKVSKIDDKDLFRFLIYRYNYSINPKIFKIEDYPPCIQIEPTSICNFRCVMCYQTDKSFSSKSHGMMGHMPIDLFKKIIDEIEGKIEAVTLASRGEPTLNPKINDMIDYCKGKFLGFKINTNASLLNEKMIHSLLSAKFNEIVFSVDAADKETYEKIRINGKFEKVFNNLKLFSEIRKKYYSETDTIVKVSGVKINSDLKVNKLEETLGEFADVVQLVGYTPWESSYDNPINNIQEPCGQLWYRMFVWWDGKVNPCDYDYKSKLSKWNVKDNTISEIWKSQEYYDYRMKHLSKQRVKINPCNRCSFTNE